MYIALAYYHVFTTAHHHMATDSEPDLDELEVFLYSQIHHAPSYGDVDNEEHDTATTTTTNTTAAAGAANGDAADNVPAVNGIAANGSPQAAAANADAPTTGSAKLIRMLANRYWADKTNPKPNPNVWVNTATATPTATHNTASKALNANNKPIDEAKASPSPSPPPAPMKKKKNLFDNCQTEQTPSPSPPPPPPAAATQTAGSNLRINPAAKAKLIKQRKKNQLSAGPATGQKKAAVAAAAGPFSQAAQKLAKAKRIKEKRDKSRLVRSKAARKPVDTIVLDSSSAESRSAADGDSDSANGSDDIIEVPLPPAPVYTISDSDSDDNGEPTSSRQLLHIEENAMNAADIELVETTTASFAKPATAKATAEGAGSGGGGGGDKIATPDSVPPSRCVSPSSVISSDDFIGQTDRCRLADGNPSHADDQDIQLLSADIDSLMDGSGIAQTNDAAADVMAAAHDDVVEKAAAKENEAPAAAATSTPQMVHNENAETNDDDVVYTDFVTPARKGSGKSYRVNANSDFSRALDVYESESDLTDLSVYAKGMAKPSVIRHIANSSDEENIELAPPYTTQGKTKRLRKRRASSGNKCPDATNNADDAGDVVDDDSESSNGENSRPSAGVHPTPLPFIAQGVALEQCNTETKAPPPAPRERTGMSDDEFIANLNNLVQGVFAKRKHSRDDDDDEMDDHAAGFRLAKKFAHRHDDDHDDDDDDDGDAEPEVSARDVAATVLPEPSLPPPRTSASGKTKTKMDKQHSDVMTVSVLSSESDANDTAEPLQTLVHQINAIERNRRSRSASTPVAPPPAPGPHLAEPAQNCGLGWNEEMRRFYADSWNGENFCMKTITQGMSRDKSLWRIDSEDRSLKSRNHHLKCRNCLTFGHTRSRCKRPKKDVVCYMCGVSGHTEARCPDTMCLRCGNKTNVYTDSCNLCSAKNYVTCAVCKVRGHGIATCPDKWRRYHSTTNRCEEPNPHIVYNSRKFCSACGRRGHLFETCRSALRFTRYPAVTSDIKCHYGVYDKQEPNPHDGIPVNLLYDPSQQVQFRMTRQMSDKNCYGRFLRAVGMDSAMPPRPRKRPADKLEAAPPPKRNVAALAGDDDDVIALPQHIDHIELDNDDAEQFKTPTVGPRPHNEPPLHMDSDSNYSFSEHFEMATAAGPITIDDEQPCTSKAAAALTAPASVDLLPDFIPLSMSSSTNAPKQTKQAAGISNRFVAKETDDEDEEEEQAPPPPPFFMFDDDREVAVQAKVHLSPHHSSFLLSPKGNDFLVATAQQCHIEARLIRISVGFALLIHGLPRHQDDFHQRLLLKYEELSEQFHRHREKSCKMPKRIDVLVRFLREHIATLLKNIGNVNELLRRLPQWERMHSKNSLKLAERARRSLNMILVGQAGLLDGGVHLEKLLVILRRLLNDFADGDTAPVELRNQIELHWKVIFSSYRHKNYPELVQIYNRLRRTNQLPVLNIDPWLLGRRTLNVQLTAEQRERLDQPAGGHKNNTNNSNSNNNNNTPTNPQNRNANARAETNSAAATAKGDTKASSAGSGEAAVISLNVVPPKCGAKAKSQPANTPTNGQGKRRAVPPADANAKQAKLAAVEQRPTPNSSSTTTTTTNNNNNSKRKAVVAPSVAVPGWQSECDTLLKKIDNAAVTADGMKAVMQDSKAPSMFWSRESLKYIENSKGLLQSHPVLQEKLKRVEEKAIRGALSYNDYRAIIKLNSTLKSK